MVGRGKVRVNGRLVKKPAAQVGAGDTLTLVQGHKVRVVRILSLPERRGAAADAALAYRDLDDG